MFILDADPDDDPRFIELVSCLIGGAVEVHQPEDVRIYKIQNWFDHKWLGFSGKALGHIGVWAERLTVPPFVANRIVHQWRYRRDEAADGYRQIDPGPDIHHRGWSARNLQRRVRQIVPTSALFWFSGNTSTTSRGSLMAYIPVEQNYGPWFIDDDRPRGRPGKYIPVEQNHWPWFLELARDAVWKVTRRKNIHAYEVRSFEERGGRTSGSFERV